MKSIFITLIVLFVASSSSAQDLIVRNKNTFELENFYQFSKYSTYYGQGISHRYALSRSFSLRQSLRYMRSHSDNTRLGYRKSSQSHVSYNLDLVMGLGKSNSWEFSLGGGYEWKLLHSYNEQQIHNDSYFGLQLGLDKRIKIGEMNRLKLGYMSSYYGGEWRNGLRLGIMF